MSILAAAALALRLFNPNEVPVDATLHCGQETQVLRLEAHGLADAAPECGSPESLLPIVALETFADDDGVTQQRDLAGNSCESAVLMSAPLFACKSGVASASIDAVDGAAYAWTAEGATIVGPSDTARIQLHFTDQATAKLTCKITTRNCVSTATGVIAVRDPLVVRTFHVPATAMANEPLTITWTYDAERQPATQVLTGDAFAQPVTLAADARSYTFTPHTNGARTIELHASYARAIPMTPKKRRRAASGGVAASECPAAQAVAKVEVKGCTDTVAVIDAPTEVAAGSTFEARVDLANGQKAEWTVDNGTLTPASLDGDRILVTAGSGGELRLGVRVERTPGCFTANEMTLRILMSASQCPAPPAATLAVVGHDCDGADVRATFTGTGPFAGTWSDGEELYVIGNTSTHRFRTIGTYTLASFHDAACFGTTTNSVTVPSFRVILSTSLEMHCDLATMTAKFTGVPPFTGYWDQLYGTNDVSFTTMDDEVQLTYQPSYWDSENRYSMTVRDAACGQYVQSGVLQGTQGPNVDLSGPWCFDSATAPIQISANFQNARPPYHVEWSDGAVADSTTSGYFVHSFPNNGDPDQVFTLAKASANGCELHLDRPSFLVHARDSAHIDPASLPSVGCVEEPFVARLRTLPSAGGTIYWKTGAEGVVLAGQGTSQATITGHSKAVVPISVTTTYPDGFCKKDSESYNVQFLPRIAAPTVQFDPPTIPAGGVSAFTWQFPMATQPQVSVGFYPSARASDFTYKGPDQAGRYTDTHGPGTVIVFINWSDCTGAHQTSATLTITP